MSDMDKTTIRSKGSTIDDAINEALLRLGARRDEVEIKVIEEGKPGVLGVFGRKRAEVEVTRKTKGARTRGGRGRDGARVDSRDGDGRRGRGRGRGRDEEPRDGRRREGGRRDEPRRDEAGRDASRREEPRRDEPRRDASRRDEPRRDEPRRDEPRRDARRDEGDGERPRRRRRRPSGDEPRGDEAKRDAAPLQEAAAESRPRRDDENRDEGERRPRRRRGGRGRGRRRGQEDGAPDNAPLQEAAAVDGNVRDEVDGNVWTESRGADEGRTDRDSEGGREPRERRPREHRERRERRPREDRQAAARIEEDHVMETPRIPRTETPLPPTGEPIAVAETTPRIAAAGVEAAETVKELTGELLRRCNFMASVRTLEAEADGRLPVRVVVDADSVEAMVGRRSTAISSVQHLVERLNQRATGEFLPLDLDINNYRQRQDGKLTRMAKDAMSRVQQGGDDDHLPPMNARERRVIHMEVAEVEGLATYTMGKGMDRHVVICIDRGEDNPPSEPDEPRR